MTNQGHGSGFANNWPAEWGARDGFFGTPRSPSVSFPPNFSAESVIAGRPFLRDPWRRNNYLKCGQLFERRIQTNQRRLGSQHAERRETWEVVKRNIARARRRLSWEHADAEAGCGAHLRADEGVILQESSDGGLFPPLPREILASRSLLPEQGPNWNDEKEGNQDRACPYPDAPKREGGTPSGPETQRLETEGNTRQGREDLAGSEKHFVGTPGADFVVTIKTGDNSQSRQDPTRGWPAYFTLSPMWATDGHHLGSYLAGGEPPLVGTKARMDPWGPLWGPI